MTLKPVPAPGPAARSSARAHRQRIWFTRATRRLTQFGFLAFIVYAAVAHHLATVDGTTASIDALCPFGGVETLWRYVSSGGQYVPKTHLSNLVLLGGLTLGTLLAGGAFCGWVCPFGAVSDALGWLRRRLGLHEFQPPAAVDRALRYGRFLVLGLILYQTIASVKLWFADFDPYRTLFGLDWLFEFNLAERWIGYAIVGVALGGSLLVERAWCRYACPLGGVISLLGRFSLLRIRRDEAGCKGCSLCERPCPVRLNVASARVVSSNCIGCLDCVEACPRPGVLEVRLQPTLKA